MSKPILDKANTAVLLMDLQDGVVGGLAEPARERLLANAAKVLATARKLQLPVVYIVVQFEEGYPEVSARNMSFSALKAAGRLKKGTPAAQIAAKVAPAAGELVVTKYRTGAFANSVLETML